MINHNGKEYKKECVCVCIYMKVKVKSLSHVWLFATPWTVAYQAPPSMGFSRQECCSGLPLPSPSSMLVIWKGNTNLPFSPTFETITVILFSIKTHNLHSSIPSLILWNLASIPHVSPAHKALPKVTRGSGNTQGASLVAQLVKHPSTMQETPVRFLGQENPMEKG